MKKFLIKLLLKFIDFDTGPFNINNEAVKEWLFLQSQNKGFLEYLKQREINIRRSATKRVLEEDKRQILVGQLLELQTLLHNVQRARDQDKNKKE